MRQSANLRRPSAERVRDLKNVILIMTSNIGARDIKSSGPLGFGTSDSPKDSYKAMRVTIEDAVKRVFNPEFLNRIDDTIVFHSLERTHIDQIIGIQMKE